MTRHPADRRIDLPSLGRSPDAEMDQEIEAHLQLAVDDLIQGGLTPEQARLEAERRFGDLRSARRVLHTAARRREAALKHRDWVDGLSADVRFALRQIRRNAAHSTLGVLTLALGIGLTTAMFTLIDRIMLQPLPFPRAEQLVAIQGEDSLRHPSMTVSSEDWLDWRAGARTLAGTALYTFSFRSSITSADSGARVNVVQTSGEFFPVLGARFLLGRPYTIDEAQSGAPVVVVSERLWREFLGADPRLETPLPMGTRSYRVVGVVADGGEYPAGTDLWQPLAMTRGPGGAVRNNINYLMLGRLRPGITIDQARADLVRVARGIRANDAAGLYDFGAAVQPLRTLVIGDVVSSLSLLMIAVLVVLLIVCANLAISTLGRGTSRQHEMAVRASLGATRSRMVEQLLVEHLLLALLAGVVGLAFAWAMVRGVVAVWGDWIPRAAEVRLDLPALEFALAVSLVVGLLAGMVPALSGSRVSLQQVMKSGGRSAIGGRHRAATALVVAEFALALMLLTGAGLLVRSFSHLLGRDLGFDRHLATVEMVLIGPRYSNDSAQRLATWDRIIERFRAIPGVRAVGAANWIPLGMAGSSFIDLPGRDASGQGAGYRTVSEGYFQAIGLRLLKGRTPGVEDGPSGTRVVVINQTMARKYWPNEDPIGRQVRATSMEATPTRHVPGWLTIIGVVTDVRQWGLEADALPEMYTSFRQAPQRWTTSMTVVVGSTLRPAQLFPQLRAATRDVDPQLAADISTMDHRLSSMLAPRRLTMSLLTGFAALALLLAALGIYAVLSYAVVRRTRELAMRSALGAGRRQLLGLVLRSGAATACIGMLLGFGGSIALSRFLRAMLVGVTTIDPMTYAGSIAILGLAALMAIMIPAMRATRLDPMIVLRGE